jgi:hypothetical protein
MGSSEHETLRDSLLARQNVPSERREKYQAEVNMLLNEKEKAMLRERKITSWAWVYLVLCSTVFLVIGGMRSDTLLGLWFSILACFWFIVGAVFLVRQRLNHQELLMLKELKGLEGRLLEVQRLLEQKGTAR